jgi:NAD(P)-dependent dehydrogenase (short-subunit alcohol dehydrogenase family)
LIVSVGVDVGDDAAIDAWARAMTTRGRRLDVVVNNAGVVGTNGYDAWDLETTTAEEMMHVFKINCVGPTLVVRALLRHGLIGADANAPSLVGNVTSKVGSVEDNGSGRGYSYRASKSALNIVTKSMSIDLASRGVHFALLHPGWVKTDMTESRGLIDAEESARGLIRVLQGEFGDCERFWFDYKGDKIPW